MSNLLISKTSQTADTSTDAWADVDGMSDTVVIGTGLKLLIATIPFDLSGGGDDAVFVRFAVDGVRQGPELLAFAHDDANQGCGSSIAWVIPADLSPGSHSFSLQWISALSKHASTDTSRVRSFQVIEITNATLLVSKISTAVDLAVPGFTDIVGLTDTQSVAAVGSILVMLGNVSPLSSVGEFNWAQRFLIGGAFEGPEMRAFNDNQAEGCGNSQVWMKTGIAGSTAFAMQWDELNGACEASIAQVRSMQVIEITADANLLAAQVSQAAHTLGASYADVLGLVATVDVVGPSSILLFAASVVQALSSDDCGSYQLFEGGTPEGPETYVFTDSVINGCGHSLYHAATGKAAGSHTFALRGENVTGAVSLDTTRNRSLAILELTGAPPPAPTVNFRRRKAVIAAAFGGGGTGGAPSR